MPKDKLIQAQILDDDNQPTGEVREIDPNRLNSPQCRGNCGYTTAQCHLLVGACWDYVCPNPTKNSNCLGAFTRQRNHLPAPKCEVCQVYMTPYPYQ